MCLTADCVGAAVTVCDQQVAADYKTSDCNTKSLNLQNIQTFKHNYMEEKYLKSVELVLW